jgi:hypothetical protein
MNAREFFDLVTVMRSKQRSYFNTRDKNELADCKRLEAQVDDEIYRVNRILELQQQADDIKAYIDKD